MSHNIVINIYTRMTYMAVTTMSFVNNSVFKRVNNYTHIIHIYFLKGVKKGVLNEYNMFSSQDWKFYNPQST